MPRAGKSQKEGSYRVVCRVGSAPPTPQSLEAATIPQQVAQRRDYCEVLNDMFAAPVAGFSAARSVARHARRCVSV